MKILLVINSYLAQLPLLQQRLELYEPLHSCTESIICYNITIALQKVRLNPSEPILQGESPSFPYVTLHINNPSPHRRWFLSAFHAYEHLGSDYDWYFILDGDTFVFLKQLESLFAEYKDPGNVSWYIGGSTEAHTSILNHGVFPYGGGGVLVSNHAMRAIYPRKATCLGKYEAIYGGDELLYRCFVDIGIKPTISSSFHQMDVLGDVTGLFETYFPQAGTVTLHHLKQTFFGYQPMDLALKQLTRASNILNGMFMRQALVESMCPQSDADRNRFFILTHGFSLIEYNPLLAERDPHIFDNQVIVKTHTFWGNKDHEHPFLFGKRLIHPSEALVDRQYMKLIREDEKFVTQEFQNCVVRTTKNSGNSIILCDHNCLFRTMSADSNAVDAIGVSNARLGTMQLQMVIVMIFVSLFIILFLKRYRYAGFRFL